MKKTNLRVFLLVLISFDSVWMVISRLNGFSPAYFVSDTDMFSIFTYAMYTIVTYIVSVICAELLGKVNSHVKFSLSWRHLVVVSFILNCYLGYYLVESYRYVSGSFTPSVLAIYYVSVVVNALVVCSYFIISPKNTINYWYKFFFIVGLAISVDGLSRALVLALILYSFYWERIRGSYFLLVLSVLGVMFLGLYGLSQKGSLEEFDFNVLLGWTASRMAIPAETAMNFIVGEHFLKSFSDSIDLLVTSFNCRLNFLNSASEICPDIKSIGGANFYSLYGIVKGGSSSGYLTSVIIGNIAAVPFILTIALIIGKLFGQIRYELKFLEIVCLYFTLKPLHSNFLDGYAIFSIVTIAVVAFVFVFLFCRLRY